MSEVKKAKKFFWISFACEVIFSATFLWMPFIRENKFGQMITGITFWLFLICGYVFIVIANYFRKSYDLKMKQEGLSTKQRIGLLNFFSNLPAKIFDTVLIVVLLLVFIISFTGLKDTYLPYPLLSLLLLSINAHCMFNGRVYIFINFKIIEGEENHV